MYDNDELIQALHELEVIELRIEQCEARIATIDQLIGICKATAKEVKDNGETDST
jgi:hypothetical protein